MEDPAISETAASAREELSASLLKVGHAFSARAALCSCVLRPFEWHQLVLVACAACARRLCAQAKEVNEQLRERYAGGGEGSRYVPEGGLPLPVDPDEAEAEVDAIMRQQQEYGPRLSDDADPAAVEEGVWQRSG